MTKSKKVGRVHVTIGTSLRQFGFGIGISRFGLDMTFMFWWLSVEVSAA